MRRIKNRHKSQTRQILLNKPHVFTSVILADDIAAAAPLGSTGRKHTKEGKHCSSIKVSKKSGQHLIC